MPTFPFYPVSEQHENNSPIMWDQLITLVLGLNTKCSPTGSWIKHLVLNLRCYFKCLWENQEEINHRMFPLPWYSEAPWAQNQYHHQLWTGTSEKMSKINSSYILLLLFGIWSQWCKENKTKKKPTLCQRSGAVAVVDNMVQKFLWEKSEKFGHVDWGSPRITSQRFMDS